MSNYIIYDSPHRAKSAGFYRSNNVERRDLYVVLRDAGFSSLEARRFRDWSDRRLKGLLSINKWRQQQ
jgi:hypothetical protein